MLDWLPLLLFAAVILATLLRGRAVRTRSGTNAFAFLEARGRSASRASPSSCRSRRWWSPRC